MTHVARKPRKKKYEWGQEYVQLNKETCIDNIQVCKTSQWNKAR